MINHAEMGILFGQFGTFYILIHHVLGPDRSMCDEMGLQGQGFCPVQQVQASES